MAPGFFQPEGQIDVPNTDLLSWMFDKPIYDLEKIIFVSANDTSRTLTGVKCREIIRKIAKGLKDAGLKRGDTLLLHSFNDINYPLIVLGTIAAGGVWTGSNPSYTTSELAHHIRASSARFIVVEPEILSTIRAAGDACGIPAANYWVFDNLPQQGVPAGYKSWKDLLTRGETDWVRFHGAEAARDTTAMRLFSSGTTGLPKAANLSHRNFVAQHTVVQDYKPRSYEPTYCLALPMFHAACVPAAHITPLRGGGRTTILRRFDMALYLRTCELFYVTEQTVVPPIILAFVMSPLVKRACFASARAAASGAAPLGLDLQRRYSELLPPNATTTQVWGMTETSCIATRFWAGEHDETGSVGYLVPGVEAKLVDEDGTEIREYNKPGEMWVRGRTVFQGYYQNDAANKESFDHEGYYKTGDIMYCDGKTKKWYIVDRKKELIKVRGFQVVPPELEGVLLQHPGIIDAAVIGITTPAGEELPRAYVVKRPGTELTEKEVYDWAAEKLAKYKRLDGGVVFLEAVPKNASGKILKKALRELAARDHVKAKL
ncbi:4-coumarate-CoA ligase-like protein [Tricharina praecox]|uniref:4-coumarate-CoA ligase-like protein n=1 Tax=Tricharina praecox TaxID=43433 RepID=UPI00222095FF|nr:4-coumarate-CoA ligase-like protein [Tricharina praecox]KAI5856369.1 4-coumarate-CoA ligase-like protein [Tricharina praecox]